MLGFAIMIFETIQMASKVAAAAAAAAGHMTCAKKEELEQTRKPAPPKIRRKRSDRE